MRSHGVINFDHVSIELLLAVEEESNAKSLKDITVGLSWLFENANSWFQGGRFWYLYPCSVDHRIFS